MKIMPAIAAIVLLVLLLTWLSLRAIDTDAERFDLALGEMDNLEMQEAALHRDVLSARAGILRNYDPLVQETNALYASVDRLQQVLGIDGTAKSAIAHLANAVVELERFVEQFKSDNALLQNSLAYFALFSSDGGGSPAAPVSSLAAAMLRLELDTSAANVREVQGRLDEVGRLAPFSGDAAPTQALLAHGRLLHDLLPATDGILKALVAVPQLRDEEALRALVVAQQSASRAKARQFRLLLYITSLILVGHLAYLGLRLQTRSRALRLRAAFEHVLAGISMQFIAARAQDLDAVIERALADLARCAGADRAYFLMAGASARTRAWCSEAAAFGPDRSNQALLLADRYASTIDGIVHIPRVSRLSPGADRDALAALAALGLQGWACASRREMDGSRILFGLDFVTRPCRITRTGGLGLLRMALDVIANALGRRSFELERARLELRLQQARRLETVGTLASGIAHNFNNIIGAILGYTEMADEQFASSGVLDGIRRAGERARELVDQILTFARPRDLHRNPVSVQALTTEATSLLRASLPAGAELVVRETSEDLIVSGVHAQLQQVILNLCNNAAQSMAYVGQIKVEVEAHHIATARTLSHGALTRGAYVRVAVSDTGRGIDESALKRIFEPFYTTRMTGSGLGLATTRDIVREHGGAMNVQSNIGVGSCFEVWLPRIAEIAPASNDDTATLPFGHGEAVLVIEDDPERLLRDEEIFAALGYEPVGFTRADEARSRCQESPERFDMVVVGHLAPMAASLELAVALHEMAPALPILLATASSDDFGANALVAAGISDVVAWPITATEMAMALQDCLRGGSLRDEGGSAWNSWRISQSIAANE
jgi:signal transduction histidine kinase